MDALPITPTEDLAEALRLSRAKNLALELRIKVLEKDMEYQLAAHSDLREANRILHDRLATFIERAQEESSGVER